MGLSRVGPSGLQTGACRVGLQGHRGVTGAGRAGRVHMAALLSTPKSDVLYERSLGISIPCNEDIITKPKLQSL